MDSTIGHEETQQRVPGTIRQASEAAEIIERQRAFFKMGSVNTPRVRVAMLDMLEAAMIAWEDRLSKAVREDLGKSAEETYMLEHAQIRGELRFARRRVYKWSRIKQVPTTFPLMPATSHIRSSGYGVSLIVSPWNYPLLLTLAPLVSAIAAGNTAILKTSERSPRTSETIAAMIDEYFTPDFITVAIGGPEITQALMDAGPDILFFTGSTQVGRILAKQAAEKMIPVVLELGGKNPCLVLADADLNLAARRIAWGKFVNAGQTCVAPDFVLVPNDRREELVQRLIASIAAMYAPGIDPTDSEAVSRAIKESPDYPRIVDERQLSRLETLMEAGIPRFGGQIDHAARYLSPTIIENPSRNSSLMREEIFGPILPIIGYDDLDDALEEVGHHPDPLSLYVFTRNRRFARELMGRFRFGGGAINDTVIYLGSAYLPFGGVGSSGIGRYHGAAGFAAFSYRSPVVDRSLGFDVRLRFPPWEGLIRAIKRLLP